MIARWTLLAGLIAATLSLSNARAQEKAQPNAAALEKTAMAFVELLDKGDFANATKDFDATMLKVMPADELKKTWEKVLGDAGAFKKQLGTRIEGMGKYEIVHVTCEFAKKKWDTRVVFDKDAKITGLFFGPAAPTAEAETYESKLKAGALELSLGFHPFNRKDSSDADNIDT